MTAESNDQGRSADPAETAADLVGHTEQLRGHVLSTAIELGILGLLDDDQASANDLATRLDLDPDFTSRLLRALVAFDVLEKHSNGTFTLTSVGRQFLPDQPEPLRDFVLFFYSPDRLAAIQHFPAIVSEGGPDGYTREYGHDLYEHCERHPTFAEQFNGFQTLTSIPATALVLETLEEYDFTQFSTVCDVGGGHGEFLANVLEAHPHLEGTVLDLPNVFEDEDRLWAPNLNVEDRCRYVEGDMFEGVPTADAYFLKAILHNWDDDDCVQLLSNIKDAAVRDARLFVIERIMSDSDPTSSTARLDMWMLLEVGGRQRTRSEYEALFERAGWELEVIWGSDQEISVLEARQR